MLVQLYFTETLGFRIQLQDKWALQHKTMEIRTKVLTGPLFPFLLFPVVVCCSGDVWTVLGAAGECNPRI